MTDTIDDPYAPLGQIDPWSFSTLVIAYDYGGTIAAHSVPHADGTRRDQPIYPQAARMIQRLRDTHGVKAILSSNNLATEPRRPALHAAGLAGYFDEILLSQELGYGKPDPRYYDALMSAAWRVTGGCEPPQIVHVGDNSRNDVAAPIQHGMRAVWVCADEQTVRADRYLADAVGVRVIARIDDLPQALGLEPGP